MVVRKMRVCESENVYIRDSCGIDVLWLSRITQSYDKSTQMYGTYANAVK